jgi:cell shape-determining protein MreC
MTINEIVRRNQELEIEYRKVLNILEHLEKKVKKLEKENEKLRKQRDILLRAITIALQINNVQKQDLHLRKVLEYIKKSDAEKPH